MKRLFNRIKYIFTTDIMEVDLTILDIFILVMTLIWAIVITLVLPVCFLKSLF